MKSASTLITKMNLLICGVNEFSIEQLESLKTMGYSISFHQDEKDPYDGDLKDLEGIVCNNFFLFHNLADCQNLKFIQLTSVGLDRVPIELINQRSIKLFNAGDAYSIPIAEWVILKILEIYKASHEFYKNQQKRIWLKNRQIYELYGKRALIVGCGNIGTAIAKRLHAFNVHVIGYDLRNINEIDRLFYNEYYINTELSSLLENIDIVILSMSTSKDTYHFIDHSKIKLMPKNSILVNISRGNAIDEKALIFELKQGKFLGVALDVFENEPLKHDNPLWEFDNVILTPHNSFISDNINERLLKIIIKNLNQISEK